jgi:hypothetical protein
MGSMRHWEAVSDDLEEAAEHLDAAARTIALIASKQDKVSAGLDGWMRDGRQRMRLLLSGQRERVSRNVRPLRGLSS